MELVTVTGAAGPDPGAPAQSGLPPSATSRAVRGTFNSLVAVIGVLVTIVFLGIAVMAAITPGHKPHAWVVGLLLSLCTAVFAPVLYVVMNALWDRFDRRMRR